MNINEPNHLTPYTPDPEIDNRCNRQPSTNLYLWSFSLTKFKTELYDDDQEFLIRFSDGEIALIEYDDFYDNVKICAKGITHYLPVKLGV